MPALSVDSAPVRPQAYRRWIAFGLSAGFTIATLYFVFRGMNGAAVTRLVEAQDRVFLIAAAGLILLQIGLGAERWRAVLLTMARGQSLSRSNVHAVFYSSVFFNSLPVGTVGGDVVRVLLARRFPLSVKQLVLSVLFDRVLVVCALVGLAVITLPSIVHPIASSAQFICVIALAAVAAGFLLLQPLAYMLGRWRNLRMVHLALQTAEELRHLVLQGGFIGSIWAIASCVAGALAAYLLARSLGIDVGPIPIVAVMAIATFLSALPISLAGWGVREISVVTMLGLIGIDREAALLLSVQIGLISTVASLPGGLVWLALKDERAAQLQSTN